MKWEYTEYINLTCYIALHLHLYLHGGFYFNFDITNFSFLSQIDTNFIKEDRKEIYKALDVFIKNKIYFYLIILFCLEIYLRKRIGLL